MDEKKQPYGTVLIKASLILDFLANCNEPQPLNAIARETGLTNSTALKILETLLQIGYVKKDRDKKFSIGTSLIHYSHKAINDLEIKDIAQPYLEELQQISGETVHLGIQDKDNVIYITKIESTKAVCTYSTIGKNLPMYCSSMGKSILAARSDEYLAGYLQRNPLHPFTRNTITREQDFRREIAKVREQGYAIDNCEHEEEVICIGTALTKGGKIHGAISIGIPEYRATAPVRQEIIAAVLQCKQKTLQHLE
ncbi:transcription regulator iclr n-terminal [Lucifera butyrica]|uniref:Transcription regulator iclr n-terminal n=1 Tax=Lucifera butyrica TaxID=1351585 RepID=A0A498RLC9_9FIRM|nr:IclR family transcriptional regulator [Lucifera butyrica]VBB09868.1 transcription regulator iclr n-terminal [Lucifera butyrica]